MPESLEIMTAQLALARSELATARRLLAHAELEKVDAVAGLLETLSRGELDLLNTRHPSLMRFVLDHYAQPIPTDKGP